MLTRTHQILILTRAEWHASRALPLVGGITMALVICAAPGFASVQLSAKAAALFLHTSALLPTTGLILLLDNPAAGVTATSPTSWWSRQVLRLAPGCVTVLAAWCVCAMMIDSCLSPQTQRSFPTAEFTGEAMTLCLLAAALAVAGTRFSTKGSGSLFAIPGLAVTLVVLLTLPGPLALFVDPSGRQWEESVNRWRVLGGCAAVTLLWLLRQGDLANRPGVREGRTRSRIAATDL